MSIKYQIPTDHPVRRIAGMTLEGGKVCTLADGSTAVDFGTYNGTAIKVRLDGRPELAAQVNAEMTRDNILAAIGWGPYSEVFTRSMRALDARDAEAVHGYPYRTNAEWVAASADLDAARIMYPAAAAYATAQDFACAHNAAKSAYGRRAVEEIEAGADPIITVEVMQSEWVAAATNLINN